MKLEKAYRSGKLQALLAGMTPEQQAQWHRAIARHAYRYLEPLLTTPEEKAVAALIQRWLDAPSDANIDSLIDHVFQSGLVAALSVPGVTIKTRAQRVLMYQPRTLTANKIRQLLLALAPNSMVEAAQAAAPMAAYGMMTTLSPGTSHTEYTARIDSEGRWQLDAAWAILNGQALPSDSDAETSANGALADYRAGKLESLIARMNDGQKEQFRHALMTLLLPYIPPLPPQLPERARRPLAACLDAAKRWLETPSRADVEIIEAEAAALEALAPPRPTMLNLLQLQKLAQDMLTQIAVNIASAVRQTVTADPALAAQLIAKLDVTLFYSEDESPSVEPPTHKQLAWWEVEAAWAILNGNTLPPLP